MDTIQNSTATFQPLQRSKGKKSKEVALKLTSMIDMFTILLVFLLKSYSAEGQIMSVSPDLNLPQSTAEKAPQTTSIIAVTEELILLDGNQVATINQIMNNQNLIISGLLNELQKIKTLSEKVGQLHEDLGFTGKISIQADKELPYIIIKKIMFTCGKVGYNDMLLAVNKPD